MPRQTSEEQPHHCHAGSGFHSSALFARHHYSFFYCGKSKNETETWLRSRSRSILGAVFGRIPLLTRPIRLISPTYRSKIDTSGDFCSSATGLEPKRHCPCTITKKENKHEQAWPNPRHRWDLLQVRQSATNAGVVRNTS